MSHYFAAEEDIYYSYLSTRYSISPPPLSSLFPYTTLFRSDDEVAVGVRRWDRAVGQLLRRDEPGRVRHGEGAARSEEQPSELQSPCKLVCGRIHEKKT